MSFACYLHVTFMRSFFIYMYSYVIRMSVVCTPMSSACHSYVLVCNGMSLGCTRMSSVCQSRLLVCHLHVTRMYSYVLVCHPYVTCMYSYVLVRHPYVTRMYLYVIRMSLVCVFTMNQS